MAIETKQLCAVIGAQWGDEGKGRLVSALNCNLCVRYNGGANAGHTVVIGEKKFDFHLIPCGIVNSRETRCLLANGTVIHLPTLFCEMDILKEKGIEYDGRILISDRAHLVFDFHKEADAYQERSLGDSKIGTTKRGIGPTYASKICRHGVRVGDLLDWDYFVERFTASAEMHQQLYNMKIDVDAELAKYKTFLPQVRPMIVDGVHYLNQAISANRSILFEGANGALLDIDFGTFPYVTSSSPGVNGIPSGCGIRPALLAPDRADIIGIVKAYTTRVGEGPFPTELLDAVGEHLQKQGHEYGTTTGRTRRCGYLDLVLLQFSHTLNGFTEINLTKLDVLSGLDTIRVCTKYKHQGKILDTFPASLKVLSEVEPVYVSFSGWQEDISAVREWKDLPENAKAFVRNIQTMMDIPITWIGVGPDRDALIKNPFLLLNV